MLSVFHAISRYVHFTVVKENHRKIIGKITIIIIAMFGNFMVKLYLNNKFNGLIDFSASDWYNKISISFFRHLNLTCWWFLDFQSLGSPYSFILLYQNAKKNTRNLWGHLGNILLFVNMDIKSFETDQRSMYHVF